MRRVLAITLLIAFFSPSLAPPLSALTTPDPETSLPRCCRSHGAHHCAMLHMHTHDSGAPALSAPPCPFYPTAATAPQLAPFAIIAPPYLFTESRQTPAAPASSPRRARLLPALSHYNRGPPARAA